MVFLTTRMKGPHIHQIGMFNAVDATHGTKMVIRISVHAVVDITCNHAGVADRNGAGVVWMVGVSLLHFSSFLNADRSLVHVVIRPSSTTQYIIPPGAYGRNVTARSLRLQ
jgi:hypothetical protein